MCPFWAWKDWRKRGLYVFFSLWKMKVYLIILQISLEFIPVVASTTYLNVAMFLLGVRVAKVDVETQCRCCFLQLKALCTLPSVPQVPIWMLEPVGSDAAQLALFKAWIQHELARTFSLGPRTHCELGCLFPTHEPLPWTHPTAKWPTTVNARHKVCSIKHPPVKEWNHPVVNQWRIQE